jgi:hypothetical protein
MNTTNVSETILLLDNAENTNQMGKKCNIMNEAKHCNKEMLNFIGLEMWPVSSSWSETLG